MASTSNDGPILVDGQPQTRPKTGKRRPPSPPAAAVALADPEDDPEEGDEDESEAQQSETAAAAPAGRLVKAKKSALTINPPVPIRRHNEDFWNWLGNATSDDWNYLIVYLWRGEPIFNSKYAGKMSNIRKIAASFDIDDVKKWEGSGGYRVDVVGLDRVTKRRERIDQEYFTINDPDFPPRLAYGPWVDFPENQEAWAWCKRLLQEKEAAATTTSTASGPGNVAEVIRETVTAMRESQADPVRDNLFNRLLEKALNPPVATAPGGEMKEVLLLMVAQEKEARHRQDDEVKELRRQVAEAKNPSGQLENELAQQVRIKKLVRELAGKPEHTEPESEWIGVAKTALERLPEAISLFNWNRGGRPQAPAQRPQQAQAPAAVAAAGQPIPEAQPAAEGATDLQHKYLVALSKHQTLLMKIVPFMSDYFVNELGAPDMPPGVAFREWFFPRHGAEAWRALRSDLPAEAVSEIIEATPALNETLNPAAKVLQFLKDFYSDPPPDETDAPIAGVNG